MVYLERSRAAVIAALLTSQLLELATRTVLAISEPSEVIELACKHSSTVGEYSQCVPQHRTLGASRTG